MNRNNTNNISLRNMDSEKCTHVVFQKSKNFYNTITIETIKKPFFFFFLHTPNRDIIIFYSKFHRSYLEWGNRSALRLYKPKYGRRTLVKNKNVSLFFSHGTEHALIAQRVSRVHTSLSRSVGCLQWVHVNCMRYIMHRGPGAHYTGFIPRHICRRELRVYSYLYMGNE